MKNKIDPRQKWLFDPHEELLAGKARAKLQNTWAGVFRDAILSLMPTDEIGGHFSNAQGRPSKELYGMCGLIVLQEYFHWTSEEAANHFMWNFQVQYALNVNSRYCEICSRTVERYRALFRHEDVAFKVMQQVSSALVAKLELSLKEQRLDSTHIFSNMAQWGRSKLLREVNFRFLKQFRRHEPQAYKELPVEFLARYATAGHWECFGSGKKSKAETLVQYAEDMRFLLRLKESCPQIISWQTYHELKRVFVERCEEIDGQLKLREKISGNVLQNPSDPDAGFSGHKGVGYHIQVAETCAVTNEVQLVTAALAQSADEHDANALLPMVEQLEELALQPELLLADAAYGSDHNVCECAEKDIELLSPTLGNTYKNRLKLEDFKRNEENRILNCPAGNQPDLTNIRREKLRASWLVTTCERCALLNQCPVRKHKNRYVLVYSEVTLRIAARRIAEKQPEFRDRYRRRSGIEGLFRRLDVLTSLKQLKVRGRKAVSMSVYLKIAMYNVYQAAKVWKNGKMEAWASNFAVHLLVRGRLQAFETRQSLWKAPCHPQVA